MGTLVTMGRIVVQYHFKFGNQTPFKVVYGRPPPLQTCPRQPKNYLSLEVGRVTPFLSREGSGICDQMLPPDLTSLSTTFFFYRIETNLPTPAPTGSKRTDARFPDPLLIPSRLDRDCNLERGSNN